MKLLVANELAPNLLLNFGGPGESGVNHILVNGDPLQEIYSTDINLIGFDPRGVNNSGPSLDCFPEDDDARFDFDEKYLRVLMYDSFDDATAELYALGETFGGRCNSIIGAGNESGLAKYANTPAVASDMLGFVEADAVAYGRSAKEAKLWFYGYRCVI